MASIGLWVMTMGKKRRSVSIDPHIAEEIEKDGAEFSPLVNKWAEDYYAEGRRPAMKEQRVEQMLEDLNKREAEFEEFVGIMFDMFDRQRSMLKEALGDAGANDEVLNEQFEEVYNQLTNRTQFADHSTPRDPENPAIRNQANKMGVSPERLVEELKERDRRDGHEPKAKQR